MTTERAAAKAARIAKQARKLAADAEEDRDRTPESAAEDDAYDLASLFAGLPVESDLRLYRKQNGRMEFCQSFADPAEFSEEQVGKKWGAGTYRLMAKKPDSETGKMQFFAGGTRTFHIAEAPPNATVPTASGGPDMRDGMLAQMWTMMLQGNEAHRLAMTQSAESHKAMLSLMLQQATAKTDPTTDLLKVLLPSLLQRDNPMDVAVKLAELMKPAGPQAAISEQLSMLERLLEFAHNRGDDAHTPPWVTGLKEVTPVLLAALQANKPVPPRALPPAPVTPTAPHPAPTVTPSSEPGVVAHVAPSLPPPSDNPFLAHLDQLVPTLARKAVRGDDAEEAAAWLLDSFDDEEYQTFGELLDNPVQLTSLQDRYAALFAHTDWSLRLLAALQQQMNPPEESAAPEAAPAPVVS